MREVEIQNIETDSTREATEILVKIPDSTYAKEELIQVDNNANQLNDEERTQLLRLIEYL